MKQVTAAIIEREGRILIARRAADQPSPGGWEFPGGKIEPGETAEACLRRELGEEFGIEVEVGEPVGVSRYEYPGGAIELLAFAVQVESDQFELRVHDEILWVPKPATALPTSTWMLFAYA